MKKNVWIILFLGLPFVVFAGGSGDRGGKVTLRITQGQPEFQAGMQSLINEYMVQHPNVTVELDNKTANDLPALIASGELPDIFYTPGYSYLETYQEYILDLSGQPWVRRLSPSAKDQITREGKVYGQPITISGAGVVYNKKIFDAHGWKVPTTLTEFTNLLKTIKAAGITPLANQFADDWLIGNYTGTVFANIPDSAAFLEKLYAGQAAFSDASQIKNSFTLLDTLVQYGQPDPMAYGWNEACSAFANEEAAMVFEGDWIWDTISAINPQIRCGMFALPISENSADSKLLVDANYAWHVNKNSKIKETALDFLNWMATDTKAKTILLTGMKVVPVFSDWQYAADNQLSMSTIEYVQNNKTYRWWWTSWPFQFRESTGKAYQEYLGGNFTKEQALAEMDALWKTLSAGN
jgi:raffinose/stachyose/melibiose transport system substrate-binding protein